MAVPKSLRIVLFFLAGAAILSLLSALQKMMIGATLAPRGFVVPTLYGGTTGALIGLWAIRLQDDRRRLAELLASRRLMLRDLHHRVQNNLQVISSILDLQSSAEAPDDGEDRRRRRIDLIATIHQVLYEMDAQYEVDVREFLGRHLRQANALLCPEFPADRTYDDTAARGEGFAAEPQPHVLVPLDTAVVVAMIVNEMIAGVGGGWHCSDTTPVVVTCPGGGDHCSVELTIPAVQVASEETDEFHWKLIEALAAQISAEVQLRWTPLLSGRIDFYLHEQRWYGVDVRRRGKSSDDTITQAMARAHRDTEGIKSPRQ
jgi:hypothetical protein